MIVEGLNPDPILEALGVRGAVAVAPVSGGWDTAIWRVELEGSTYALRVFRPEQVEVSRHEVAAMRAAAEGGISVPVVRADGVWQDRPALLLSWCEGRPLAHELRARPWLTWRLGLEFGRMQALIHAVAAPEALRHRRVSWIDWMGPDEPDLKERLIALGPRQDALLHLDYHPLNVMVDGTRLAGVLDWANARAGDPRADLARTVTILRLAPLPRGPRGLGEMAVRRLLELGWRRGYEQAAGPFGDLSPFYAWAGAAMVRDLAPKLGRPGVALGPVDFERMRRWTNYWKRRAGV
jgi:aminoglycoside phosphotransferase (APT) family kinase protein